MQDDTTPQVEGGAFDAAADGLGPRLEALSFSTTLRLREFLWLSLKNGLLNIITLTFYRFWGKTEVRRRVWRGVRLNDEAFEYTGRGLELFLGFVFALLVVGLPFLLTVFGVQFLGPAGLVLLLFLYPFIFWLWGYGIFSAYRYMASRTTWRGVRFRLTGSAVGFGLKHLAFMVLNGMTLGWFAPTAQRKLAGYVWDELRFGNRRVRFHMARAEKVGVYGWFALGWFLTVLPGFLLIAAFAAFGILMAAMGTGMVPGVDAGMDPGPAAMMMQPGVEIAGQPTVIETIEAGYPPYPPEPLPPPTMEQQIAVMVGSYLALAVFTPIYLLFWAPYNAALMRSIAAGVGFGEVRFSLDVSAIGLWWLTVSNLFCIIVSLGLLTPWVQARTARWLISRLRAKGEAELEVDQARAGPRTGEGLADAFGFSLI